jgi:hypothetical protein
VKAWWALPPSSAFTGKDAPLAVVSGAFESTGQWLGLVALVLVLVAFARRILPAR